MKPKLKIRISGHIGCGKTTLARYLALHLEHLGASVHVNDIDLPEKIEETDHPPSASGRMVALANKGLEIEIEILQLRAPFSRPGCGAAPKFEQ